MITSATAQYGARVGTVGVAGAAVLGGGVAVGEGVTDGDGDGLGEGLGDGVGTTVRLGDGVLVVGTGVGVEEESGGAHVSASDAANARCSGVVNARRDRCSLMTTGARLADGDLREESEVVHPGTAVDHPT